MSSKDNLELFSKNTENNPDQNSDHSFPSRTSHSPLSSTLNHASSSNADPRHNFSLKNPLQDPSLKSTVSITSPNEKNNHKHDKESLILKPIPIRPTNWQQTSKDFTHPQQTESISDLFANHSVLKPTNLDFPSANSNFSTALPQSNEYIPNSFHVQKYHPYTRVSYSPHSAAHLSAHEGNDNISTSPPYHVPALVSNPSIPRISYSQGGIHTHPVYTSNQHPFLPQQSSSNISDQRNEEQESKVPQKKYIFKDYSSNDPQLSPPLFSMKQMQQIPPPSISPFFQPSLQNNEASLLPPASSIDPNLYINPHFSRHVSEDVETMGSRFMAPSVNFPLPHHPSLPTSLSSASSSSTSSSKTTTTGDSDSGGSQQGPAFGEWTPEEHEAFLRGYQMFGHGKWKEISDSFVPSRTRIQVASHAQKWIRSQRRKQERLVRQQQKHQENGGDSGLS